jgi:hypothetical protein
VRVLALRKKKKERRKNADMLTGVSVSAAGQTLSLLGIAQPGT